MLRIASLFGVSLATSTHNNPPRYYWSIDVSTLSGVQTVTDYFDLFPLMGTKYLDYLNFKAAFTLGNQGVRI